LNGSAGLLSSENRYAVEDRTRGQAKRQRFLSAGGTSIQE